MTPRLAPRPPPLARDAAPTVDPDLDPDLDPALEAARQLELDAEQRLLGAAVAGDAAAMRALLERHIASLYGSVILPRLGDAAAAEEVLRETLATAALKLERFTWQGRGVFPWLRQIAINKIIDQHRRSKRSRRLLDALAQDPTVTDHLADRADASLLAAQERSLQRRRIDAALAAVAVRYRHAIELRLIAELSRDECAAHLGVTVATFDVLLFRAVRAFRLRYGARGDHDDLDLGQEHP